MQKLNPCTHQYIKISQNKVEKIWPDNFSYKIYIFFKINALKNLHSF